MQSIPAFNLPPACLNCGHLLLPQRLKFCPACGQETNVKPPRIAEFLQQFGGAYFATEGALWRTLKLLLFKPGELTVQYLAGRRKHYVLPLRMFLSAALLMLLVVRLSGSADFTDAGAGAGAGDPVSGALERPDLRPLNATLNVGSARLGLRDGVYFCQGFPPWMCQRMKRNFDVDPPRMLERITRVNERVLANAGAMMFVLMPAFALGLAVLYRNRGLRYTEHLVFTLHLHALWALLLAVMVLGFMPLVVACGLALPLYAALALRRVYGGRWGWLLLRLWVLTSAHAVVVAFTVVAAVLLAMLF